MKVLAKSKKLTRQIRTKFARLETQIVTVSLGLGLVIARFAYIYFLDNDIKGSYLGYRWLSTFIYAIGIELAFIFTGALMHYSTNFMVEEVRKAFKNISYLVMTTGGFFLFWAIYTHILDYNKYTEMLIGLATAIMFVSLFVALSGAAKSYVEKLREGIRILVNAFARKVPPHVKNIDVYEEEVLWPTLDKLTDEV